MEMCFLEIILNWFGYGRQQKLLEHRKAIFPFSINDMPIMDDLTMEADYRTIIKACPKVPTMRELTYLLKYRKFVEQQEVYSMCDLAEVVQTELLVKSVISRGVRGSIVETGVWRGGMSMYMKAIVKIFEPSGDRHSYLFDTFSHFPDATHPTDQSIHAVTKLLFDQMQSVQNVRRNFRYFDLLDERVHFEAGLFQETMPKVDPGEIAILRLDSDYYDSTMFVLEQYYSKVVSGGFVIIDDYNNVYLGCKQAVHDFRYRNGITAPIQDSHGGAVYWMI